MNTPTSAFAAAVLVASLGIAACTTDVVISTGDYGDEDVADTAAIAAGPAIFWPRVARGEQSQDVVTVQYLLARAGRPVELNGVFTAAVDTAVRAVQTGRGLVSDGIVGEQTWLALVVEVKSGDSGPAVQAAQYLLKNRYGQNLSVTGEFGPTTLTRLKSFQTSVCLEATGVVGRYTWNALIARRSFCSGGGNPTGPAAQRVLAYHQDSKLTLWDQTFGRFDGADPLSNIRDAAGGRAAKTSCYGNAPCTRVQLTNGLLNGLAGLRERYGYDYFVTAIAGANHGATSYHFVGRAVDIGEVNGVTIAGDSAIARGVMAACRAMGAVEVLGPSNDAGHQDHIHCAW